MVKKIVTLVFLTFLALLAQANDVIPDQAYLEILRRPTRPTMLEIESLLPSIEEAQGIPMQAHRGFGLERWVEILLQYTPDLIAAMEKTYPGATWIFLGRDSQAIADVMEAFYLRLGQKDRVKRLGMSKATLGQASPDDVFEYFQGIGFSFERSLEHPFVIVDTISSGYGRQARTVLAAVYRQYLKENPHRTLQDLFERVNIFGLIVSTFQGQPIPYWNFGEYLNSLKERYREAGADFDFFNQHLLLTYPQAPEAANEAGYEHFTFAWHRSYGPLERNDQNQLVAPLERVPRPMAFSKILGERSSILWLQKQIYLGVQDEVFLARVRYAALGEGYHFPQERPQSQEDLKPGSLAQLSLEDHHLIQKGNGARLRRYKDLAQQIRNQYQSWISQCPQLKRGSFRDGSPNGQGMAQIYSSAWSSIPSDLLRVVTLASLRKAYQDRKITQLDSIIIFMSVMIDAQPSAQLTHQIKLLMRDLPHMRRLVERVRKRKLMLDAWSQNAWPILAKRAQDHIRVLTGIWPHSREEKFSCEQALKGVRQ